MFRCVALAGLLAQPWQVSAVIFDATDDLTYHTNAPTGALTNSGWQFEGKFGAYLGTAIAPHYFLTARHIGGDTNTLFNLDGTNYQPIAWFNAPSPGSDLRLWQVADRLPRYAPIYTGTNEVGATLAVFGRGTQRGNAIVMDGLTNGWSWGTADHVLRWGSNCVTSIETGGGAPYLYATFDHNAGPDECHLSVGDSGGAAFILADGVWQLAGIHYAVDGQFNTTNTGAGFDAAIYDESGLYIGTNNGWTLITNHVASGFYSSRVSAHYAWLTNTIADFDSNANGMPDWWELQYSGTIHGLAPTNDPDADGQNNLAEWIARTDPTNPASFFRIAAFACTNQTPTVSFTGWSNRLYSVYQHDNPLTNGTWTLATNAFAGSDGPTTWTDNMPAATSRFYRIEVALPP
ncbi:MAG: hypothetical protein ACOYOU_04680 [Kiritimatiellia bacterium]